MTRSLDDNPRWRVLPAPPLGLCLAFANTRYWRGEVAPTETLGDYRALLRWLGDVGVVDNAMKSNLRTLACSQPLQSLELLESVKEVREHLYATFRAVAAGEKTGASLAKVDNFINAAPARSRIARNGKRLGWQISMGPLSSTEVLAPVLWSAADLLLGSAHAQLRLCANDKCRWLFFDDSKSKTRRWCSMATCGNRFKVAQHARRHAQRDPTASG